MAIDNTTQAMDFIAKLLRLGTWSFDIIRLDPYSRTFETANTLERQASALVESPVRCGSCQHWKQWTVHKKGEPPQGGKLGSCAKGIVVGDFHGGKYTPIDFGCNRWEANE